MGSPNGLWTAVSGGMAQSHNVDIIANNLANVNTTGFKKDAAAFKEYLTAVERPPSPTIDIPRTVFKDSDFYHHDGRENVMVNVDRTFTDHTQGNLKPTNAPFDMAIDGPGFFAVNTPSGIMYTRAGDFKVNGAGVLMTNDGYEVMALAGEAADVKNEALLARQAGETTPGAPAAPGRNPAALNPFTNPAPAGGKPLLSSISLKDSLSNGLRPNITPNGQVFVEDQLVATLAVAEFPDAGLLQKVTSTLYANPNATNVPKTADLSRVQQGFVETSNVNPVSEIVNLLKANRMYESNMRAIKAYNDMAGKEANEVGKL